MKNSNNSCYKNELSIVHIEDEYIELKSLVFTIKTFIEDYYEEIGSFIIGKCTICDEEKHSWLVYEIKLEVEPGSDVKLPEYPPVIRYLLIKDATIPQKAKKWLFDRRIFILDVLRPANSGSTLEMSIHNTLKSVLSIKNDKDQIVFYTAYNGQGLDDETAGPYEKFSKSEPHKLDVFLNNQIQELITKSGK